jgi:hypothetical protein
LAWPVAALIFVKKPLTCVRAVQCQAKQALLIFLKEIFFAQA